MTHPSPPPVPVFPLKTVLGIACFLGILLLGCSLGPFQRLRAGLNSEDSRFYSYFILHGAAQSHLGREKLSPEETSKLLEADNKVKENLLKNVSSRRMGSSLANYIAAIHPN